MGSKLSSKGLPPEGAAPLFLKKIEFIFENNDKLMEKVKSL